MGRAKGRAFGDARRPRRPVVGGFDGLAHIVEMATWIALLRGINVGGANRLPMAELRKELEDIGLDDVQTYIQTGNIVFGSDAEDEAALAGQIAATIEDAHGFRPRVLLLSAGRLREAMDANPFPEAEAEPKTVHLYFLAEQPADFDRAALDGAASSTERCELGRLVFYLHTPDGFGSSKLASRAERILGVPATARNWRTVARLWEMAERQASGG